MIDSDMQTFTFAPDGSICWEAEDSCADRSRFRIPSPDSQSAVSPMRWMTGGEAIEIQGITIARGMMYVGFGKLGEEPSLVNPLLSIATHDDGSAEPVALYPTYDGMSPICRRRYLEWLADGARAFIEIGYVFLYFFGLERRLLHDEGVAGAELSALITEVGRLSKVFERSSDAFRFYSRGLRDYIQLRYFPGEVPDSAAASIDALSYELPIAFRFGLGRFVRDQQPVPAEWALRWALTDRLIHRRTPVVRCPVVFEQAFTHLYDSLDGDEMLLFRVGKVRKQLKVSYSAVSPALRHRHFSFEMDEIPDVSDAEDARRYLLCLVEDATSWIEPYSRFLGREPSKSGTLKAYLNLPSFLWPADLQQRVRELRESVVPPLKTLSCVDLFAHLGYSGVPSPQTIAQLADRLRYVGIGMEPDAVAGARRPGPNDMVVLFPFVGDMEQGPRDTPFQTASVTVTLASRLALIDDASLGARRLQAIEEKIATWRHLTPDRQMRLRAQYQLDLLQPVSLSARKAKVSAVREKERLDVLLEVAELAKAYGILSGAKIRFIEQLCDVFELDAKLVYGHLFSTSKGLGQVQSTHLDRGRISALRKETESVSALLGQVFDEELTEIDAEPGAKCEIARCSPLGTTNSVTAPLLRGLSPSHNAFLVHLLTRYEWSRAELETTAAERKIMLDGAMESINASALDAFGTMLTDGYDPIFIERELLEKPTI